MLRRVFEGSPVQTALEYQTKNVVRQSVLMQFDGGVSLIFSLTMSP
jgi:hypothetical protein